MPFARPIYQLAVKKKDLLGVKTSMIGYKVGIEMGQNGAERATQYRLRHYFNIDNSVSALLALHSSNEPNYRMIANVRVRKHLNTITSKTQRTEDGAPFIMLAMRPPVMLLSDFDLTHRLTGA